MLVVERRENDIHMYDVQHNGFFDASIKYKCTNKSKAWNIEIRVRTNNLTDVVYMDKGKIIEYKCISLYESARTILAEYYLYESLFNGEEFNYMFAEEWLDKMDGGGRCEEEYDDEYDDDDDDDEEEINTFIY